MLSFYQRCCVQKHIDSVFRFQRLHGPDDESAVIFLPAAPLRREQLCFHTERSDIELLVRILADLSGHGRTGGQQAGRMFQTVLQQKTVHRAFMRECVNITAPYRERIVFQAGDTGSRAVASRIMDADDIRCNLRNNMPDFGCLQQILEFFAVRLLPVDSTIQKMNRDTLNLAGKE